MHENGPSPSPADCPKSKPKPGRLLGRWLCDERVWLAGALLCNLLWGWSGEGASGLAWLNPLLFVVALVLRSGRTPARCIRLAAGGWATPAVVVLGGWAAGMGVELTIATGGSGFGGTHPDTARSFLLAQGFYVPAALLTWIAVRRHGLGFRRAFLFAGAMCWWEAATVGIPALLSPAFFAAPLVLAYFASTYGLFGATGLLFVSLDHGPGGPARKHPRPVSRVGLLLRGAAAGAACWAIFLAWAWVIDRLLNAFA